MAMEKRCNGGGVRCPSATTKIYLVFLSELRKINERKENVFERYSSERQYSVSYKTFIFYIYIYNCNNFNSALSKLSIV